MAIDRVDILTQAMNAAFVNSYEAIADQPALEKAITTVPSKGRIENYPWLYPPPLLHQWKGYRQYAKLGETNYRVPNITYTAEFEVMKEDMDDDQVGGFKLQASAMADGAKNWKIIQSLQNLALGQTTLCFDGTNLFASSHTVGTGNNIFTATTAGTDAVTHCAVALVLENKLVKPLLWQNREGPDFKTDLGELHAERNRMYKWWCDLRGAAAFGFWWDLVLIKFANTPTVAEVQTALGTLNARLRGFKYPTNLPSDVAQYPHGQRVFDNKSLLIICSTLIEHIFRQALTLSLIANTENYYKGFADLLCSGYLDSVT